MSQPSPVPAGKIPAVTLTFWLMKICATTLGETAGDLLSMTLNWGYLRSSITLVGFFLATFGIQMRAKRFNPWLYWLVILSTSTAGTTMSDFMDRTLHLGYAAGSAILVGTLVAVLMAWRLSLGTISIDSVKDWKSEAFYWCAILVSNTLGTALGDFLSDSSGLGFVGAAALIGGILLVLAGLHFFTKTSKVVLFWAAFVLTRPFGASFGDLLTKTPDKGGLNLGTGGSSAVLLAILIGLILWLVRPSREAQEAVV